MRIITYSNENKRNDPAGGRPVLQTSGGSCVSHQQQQPQQQHHYQSSSPPSSCSPTGGGGQVSPSQYHHHSSQQFQRVNVSTLFSRNPRTTNVSMYKFINSKGKQISPSDQRSHHDFFDNGFGESIRAARLVAMSNPNFYRKRLSAIDKIQEELREMKSREDELRGQRVRGIGLSYPNLSSMCDDDFTSDDQTVGSSEENRDSLHSRYSSNPDLLANNNNNNNNNNTGPTFLVEDVESSVKVGGPRKKISLIAMWEQKIQQTIEDK